MEKRLIIAIALSILVIVTFQHLFVKPIPRQAVEAKDKIEPVAQGIEKSLPPPPALTKAAISEERELKIETDKYILTFSNVGGAIKKIQIKDYKDPHSDEPLHLVDIKDPRNYLFSISDPTNSTPIDNRIYESTQDAGMITYSLRLGGTEIKKEFILHNSKYTIELRLSISNRSGTQRDFVYRLIGGAGIVEHNIQDARFVEAAAKIDEKVTHFKKPKGGRTIAPGLVDWTCLKNKYFSLVLKPMVKTQSQFYDIAEDGSIVTGVEVKDADILPNYSIENRFAIYAGPTQAAGMKDFGYGIEETINYGFFGAISKAMLAVLRLFYRVVRNWGAAIILLSIFLNIILFPLTLKSFRSMQKMQALHPQMEKLKTQHKDNPQKLNKEIMELYKKYNINPLSGCLPMLLQMPVFIALYNALIRSIELKGVSFLWIRDLSLPDAAKIPFPLPLFGDHINILPLLMVVGMVFQQKISTKSMGGAVTDEQKQQQKMMLIIMPIVFGFIFYNMPSGLVLYWLINTVLTILEQGVIFKQA